MPKSKVRSLSAVGKDFSAPSKSPFDYKFNREKDNALNKPRKQTLRIRSGAARQKTVDKRKNTLLDEYERTRRTGNFSDMRIGEGNMKLSDNDKMFLRYAEERKQSYENKMASSKLVENENSAFNIKERQPGERSNEYSYGGLSERAVAEIHFGKGESKKDWRDRLDQIISDSKQAKYEKHAEKYETFDKVDELDNDWAMLRGEIFLAGAPLPPELKSSSIAHTTDYFDKAVNELRFDKCPDHNKVAEAKQCAIANEKRRKRFESETLAKMNVLTVMETTGERHISADALEEECLAFTKKGTRFREMKPVTYTRAPHGDVPSRILEAIENTSEELVEFSSISEAIEAILSKNNPELFHGNKEKFLISFSRILRYIFDASDIVQQIDSSKVLFSLNDAADLLFSLCKTYIPYVEKVLLLSVVSHLRALSNRTSVNCGQLGRCYCLLKFISAVFPTSDAFHPVVTPSFTLMAAVLRNLASVIPKLTHSDRLNYMCLTEGFIDLAIQYVSRSRRYIPESIICLVRILTSLSSENAEIASVSNNRCLFVEMPCTHSVESLSDRILSCAEKMCHLWSDIPGSQIFFKEIVSILATRKESTKYVKVWESFSKCISSSLVPFKSKAVPVGEIKELASLVPVVSGKSRVKESRPAQATRLKRQIRKEYRSAVRELRRDNAFLARVSLQERITNDEERDKKTKRIIGQLAMQEGEYKKLKKLS